MRDTESFIDVVHLAASLVDPQSQRPTEDRLRAALPAALGAIGNASFEQVIEFVRGARAAGVRFKGTDEAVARMLQTTYGLGD